MVGNNFFSLNNIGHIWNFNMADIECIFERRVPWDTI